MIALRLIGGLVVLVDESTGEERWQMQAHFGHRSITVVAMSPNGRFVASVGSSRVDWKLWEAANWG
jgi:hypothetical protein